MSENALKRFHERLGDLAKDPPAVLLMEGGTEAQRLESALFWAKCLNCPAARAAGTQAKAPVPCNECPICKQIDANENMDLHIFDGRIPNSQDEEKPGPIRGLRMENIRRLKASIGLRPHGDGKRVVIFQGMLSTREEALNSLLKTLEEPGENTMFVLLAPQRAQILPTLVSRSHCLTLPWLGSLNDSSPISPLERDLADFLRTGQGFLDRIVAKNVLDASSAGNLLVACQKSVARVLGGKSGQNPLDSAFSPLAAQKNSAALVASWLAEAQEMLAMTVSPARVLQGFASRLFLLLRKP